MIGIIDYGAGNLFSVKNALSFLGFDSVITSDKKQIERADSLILPGVGAFPDAMNKICAADLLETIRTEAKRKPFLGICLGMQLLFEKGYEFGETEGLKLIPGTVELLHTKDLKVPHMGWNDLVVLNECPLTRGIGNGEFVYYVHSYAAVTADKYLSAYSEYGQKVPGIVFNDSIYGTQFHPEKSGDVGLMILKNFGGLSV